ncbi:hypothetical protein [Silvanigrella aquatica]|uniref:Solute-binding protein family 3/N-terminal domain-containing protein n=1 Tax=Silvanigrella aquatica TaxID=1915309 RepID=A0A1L4D1L5_9BACT|nr:hypothetical protein [Silvanigrella aquatica]APJ04092.1 hypothetical protein AXG55_09300 [Silvanigrella aquatica]
MIKNVTIFFILLLYQICANSETISVVYQIRPPYHTNEKDGILDKILIKIEKLSGMPFSMINIPLQRGLNMIVENKEKICLAANYKNSEREKIAKISIPLYQEKGTVIIFRKDDNNFNEPLKLQNLLMNKKLILLTKVGLSYGKYIDELLKKNNNNVEQSSTDQESMIKK